MQRIGLEEAELVEILDDLAVWSSNKMINAR
jgi:hypothetical protein